METYRKKTLNIKNQQYSIIFEVNEEGSAYKINVMNDSTGKSCNYNLTKETMFDFNQATGENLLEMVEAQISSDVENGLI